MRQCYLSQESRQKGLDKCREISKQKTLLKLKDYDTNPTLCFVCKKSLPYKKRHNKFCSHSCSASLGNLGVKRFFGKVIEKQGEKIVQPVIACRICLYCGSKLNTRRSCRVYCSGKCNTNHKKHERNKKITEQGFLISSPKDKCYLEETRGKKCEICGTSEWTNKPVPLVFDHIDGNSDNNILSNVRLICHNCNALTDTYCGKNKGKGRWTKRGQYRNSRYQQGLSY